MSVCSWRPTVRDFLGDVAFDLNSERKLDKKKRNKFEAERQEWANNWHTPGTPECPTPGTTRGQNARCGSVYMPGLNWHGRSRWAYVFWKAGSSGPFTEYKKETECIVFNGWTALTQMGHWADSMILQGESRMEHWADGTILQAESRMGHWADSMILQGESYLMFLIDWELEVFCSFS